MDEQHTPKTAINFVVHLIIYFMVYFMYWNYYNFMYLFMFWVLSTFTISRPYQPEAFGPFGEGIEAERPRKKEKYI